MPTLLSSDQICGDYLLAGGDAVLCCRRFHLLQEHQALEFKHWGEIHLRPLNFVSEMSKLKKI